jgi:hypothetical protein
MRQPRKLSEELRRDQRAQHAPRRQARAQRRRRAVQRRGWAQAASGTSPERNRAHKASQKALKCTAKARC